MKKKWEKPSVNIIPCDVSMIQENIDNMPEEELQQQLENIGLHAEMRYIVNEDYILRDIAGEAVLVSVGSGVADFCGIVNLNPAAKVLWQRLENGATEKELVSEFLEKFSVEEEKAVEDVRKCLGLLEERGLIKNG